MKLGHKLETDRLIVRPWTNSETDRDAMYSLQSNPIVRKYYPSIRTKQQSDEFIDLINDDAEIHGLGWGAICLKDKPSPIGFSGLSRFEIEGLEISPAVETGWQLLPEYWGCGYVTEAASELLRHGFEELDLQEVFAFAVPKNTASTAVMDRIGMSEIEGGAFDHPQMPDSKPHLKRHVLYKITATQWLAQNKNLSLFQVQNNKA